MLVNDHRASGKHVWIGLEQGRLVAIDQGTTNGTYINDINRGRITRAELRDGDVIIVGDPEIGTGRFRIVYVEQPVTALGPARLVVSSAGPLVDVITPCTPLGDPGFHDAQLPGLKPLLDSHFQALRGDIVLWFGTAMALPLAASVHPRAVVYDGLDEPGAFDRLPRQLRQRESALLRIAQLVLVGGPSLLPVPPSARYRVRIAPCTS